MDDLDTLIRRAWTDRSALEELFLAAQTILDQLARRQRLKEQSDLSLLTDDIRQEVCLRILPHIGKIKDEKHFLHIALRVIRQVLTDHARRRKAIKRGGGRPTRELFEGDWITTEQADQWLLADGVLVGIEGKYPREVWIFELAHVGGLKPGEIASVLAETEGVSVTDGEVRRALQFVRALVLERAERGEPVS